MTGRAYGSARTPRERFVVELLDEHPGPMTLGDLTEWVNRWEAASEDYGPRARGDTHAELYERLLPALQTRELARFDVDRGIVSAVPPCARRGVDREPTRATE